MNTLEKDFNQFMNRRLTHVKSHLPSPYNAAAIALERTLNDKQLQLFVQAFNYSQDRSSIIEENAYRQGMIDALGIIGILGH